MAKSGIQRAVAKSQTPAEKGKVWVGAPRGYVSSDLTRGEQQEFAQWRAEEAGEKGWHDLCSFVDDGYRVTMAEDAHGFKAAATNVSGPSGGRGLCLSGYASTAEGALLSLMYKHYVKLEREWPDPEVSDTEYFR
jgi:hypothetical protein